MNMGMRTIRGAALGVGFWMATTGALASAMVPNRFERTLPEQMANVPHNVSGIVAKATYRGQHNPQARLDIVVSLKLRNSDKLQQFLLDVKDPTSPHYHKFKTPAQLLTQYGPTQDQIAAVTGYLKSQGINVEKISASGMLIMANASTGTLERVFGVQIGDYSYQGRTFYSANRDPLIPARLAGIVQAIMGLDDAVQMQPHYVPSGTKVTVSGKGAVVGGYSPQQVATAYGWPNITRVGKAKNVTIAIATAYGFRMADIRKFWSTYGLPAHNVSVVNVPQGLASQQINGETTLDIEHSSAMAPGSNLIVYEALNPGFTLFSEVYDQILTDNLADVVSTSWGAPEFDGTGSPYTPADTIKTDDNTFLLMAAAGMAVFAAAGDNGAADGQSPATSVADFPASDPNVVAAGGTSLYLNDDSTIAQEDAWSGAGGADSGYFKEPAYQTGAAGWVSNTACSDNTVTNDSIDAATGCAAAGDASRQSSDLSMDADPSTAYTYYFNGRWKAAGGTSFVAPQLAGLWAIVVRRATLAEGVPTRLGAANSYIYSDAALHPEDFNDIVTGSNGFGAATGWDHPTGWGSPANADALANDIVTIFTSP